VDSHTLSTIGKVISFPLAYFFLPLLSLNYVFPANAVSLFCGCHPRVCLHLWSVTGVLGRLELHCGVVIVVCPEGCHQHGMVDGVIVCTFCQRWQFNPVVLHVVAKGSEVIMHRLILPLSVTVCLQEEGGRKSVIDTEVGTYSVLKSTGKLPAAIGGDIVWYTTFAD